MLVSARAPRHALVPTTWRPPMSTACRMWGRGGCLPLSNPLTHGSPPHCCAAQPLPHNRRFSASCKLARCWLVRPMSTGGNPGLDFLWVSAPPQAYSDDFTDFLNPHLGADFDFEGPPVVLPILVHMLPVLVVCVLHGTKPLGLL